MNMKEDDSKELSYPIAGTVLTAFSILEFIGEKGKINPVQAAKSLGLSRTAVYKMLYTLEQMGLIDRNQEGKYGLTFRLFELGTTVPHSYRLIDTAKPAMLELSRITRCTVNHAVLHENEVLYIDKVEEPSYLRLDRTVGKTDPVHCTSLGKVLLAFSDSSRVEKIISTLSFKPRTSRTITDPGTYRLELQKVKEQGYALDDRELSMELRCVAAPVFGSGGAVVSAISMSGPSDRFTDTHVVEALPLLLSTVRSVSDLLSF